MVQVTAQAKGTREGACLMPPSLIRPMMELIRANVDELEPLMKALDQRAYEKGFEDGRTVSQ